MGAAVMKLVSINRNEGLGGTDAKRIVEGDWLPLYEEKVGLREPVDLSDVFKVQLGSHTEDFHLDWIARREGWEIKRITDRLYHPEHRFLFAHLDGWCETLGVPVETKHCGGDANVRDRAQYYMPQVQHYMHVAEADAMIFSMIAGNKDPEHVRIDRCEDYIKRMFEMQTAFWWHVENKEPPEVDHLGVDELQQMASVIPIDGLRDYDMQGNNEWATHAVSYIKHENAAQAFEAAKKGLKELVPADAAKVSGYGLTIKRSKNGSLRFAA